MLRGLSSLCLCTAADLRITPSSLLDPSEDCILTLGVEVGVDVWDPLEVPASLPREVNLSCLAPAEDVRDPPGVPVRLSRGVSLSGSLSDEEAPREVGALSRPRGVHLDISSSDNSASFLSLTFAGADFGGGAIDWTGTQCCDPLDCPACVLLLVAALLWSLLDASRFAAVPCIVREPPGPAL